MGEELKGRLGHQVKESKFTIFSGKGSVNNKLRRRWKKKGRNQVCTKRGKRVEKCPRGGSKEGGRRVRETEWIPLQSLLKKSRG